MATTSQALCRITAEWTPLTLVHPWQPCQNSMRTRPSPHFPDRRPSSAALQPHTCRSHDMACGMCWRASDSICEHGCSYSCLFLWLVDKNNFSRVEVCQAAWTVDLEMFFRPGVPGLELPRQLHFPMHIVMDLKELPCPVCPTHLQVNRLKGSMVHGAQDSCATEYSH